MAYTYLKNSTTADVVEVRDNFTHVASGSRLPMGGSMLAATTGAYDLGASTAVWNNVFCNNLEISGSISSSRQLWVLLSEVIVTETGTSIISFSGLNGDETSEYKMIYHLRCEVNPTIGFTDFDLELSSYHTTSTVYDSQFIRCANASIGSYNTSTAVWFLCRPTNTSYSIGTLLYYSGVVNFSLKTGKPRMGTGQCVFFASGTTDMAYQTSGYSMDNEGETTQTLNFRHRATSILTGSVLQLWGIK